MQPYPCRTHADSTLLSMCQPGMVSAGGVACFDCGTGRAAVSQAPMQHVFRSLIQHQLQPDESREYCVFVPGLCPTGFNIHRCAHTHPFYTSNYLHHTHIYLHTYIYIYIYIYIYMCSHTYTYIFTNIQISVHTSTHIYTYMHIYMYTYIYTHIHRYTYIYMCIYTYMCIHIYIYT